MDLVDLDRVLDEFEAKEEQQLETDFSLDTKSAAVFKGSEYKKSSTSEINDENSGFNPKIHSFQENGRDTPPLQKNDADLMTDNVTLIELSENGHLSLPATDLPSSSLENGKFSIDSMLFSNDTEYNGKEPALLDVLPPDVTNNAIASNIDQEPEDPISSANLDIAVKNVSEQSQPQPDVVAGHQISQSRSSTPSPIHASKKPVGFYDENAQDGITEEELERYLEELDQKIGDSANFDDGAKKDLQNIRTGEDLNSYLEKLEEIGGNVEITENAVVCGNSKEEKDSHMASEDKHEDGDQRLVVETSRKITDASVEDGQVVGLPDDSPEVLPIKNNDLSLQSNEPLPALINSPGLDQEHDLDDDTYVMLAFSSPENSVSGQDLKTELEQAMAGQSNIYGDDNVMDHVSKSLDETQDKPEVGQKNTPLPFEQTDNSVTSSSDGNVDSDVVDQGDLGFAAQASSSQSEPNLPTESTSGLENASANEPAPSKRQLVTVCRLDAVLPPNAVAAASGDNLPKLTESELQLGRVQPIWIPDVDSIVCMLCESKFTLIRRRHHCRACGRVLCNVCCNQRAKLPYLEAATSSLDTAKRRQQQDARVCNSCHERLKRIEEYEKELAKQNQSVELAVQNELSDTTSTGASTSSATATTTPILNSSSFQRPPVLKREGTSGRRHGEPKQVVFSDGIKPGGDLTETPPSTVTTPSIPSAPVPSNSKTTIAKPTSSSSPVGKSGKSSRARELESFFDVPNVSSSEKTSNLVSCWPPILDENGVMVYVSEDDITKKFADMLEKSTDENSDDVTFVLKRNLRVHTKITQIDCCLHRLVWCFATDGLRNVSQDEILIVMECAKNKDTQENERTPPTDVFMYLNALYEEALKGKLQGDLTYVVFSQLDMNPIDPANGYFGSKDNAGFLHYRPTYQCLQKLCLPEQPFLIGVLIQKSEVSWAKVLPLRLLLRLGVEYRYYPYPLISDRSRKALFYETGHTIMNLLTDMRNFTYTLQTIPGCTIALENDKTIILIPSDQCNQAMKILQSSNEHVLAWAAGLHKTADAHLVCVQQLDTLSYTSQTINRENHERKITGACFVVFNASLKAGGPVSRISIVEDGIMIQIRTDAMERLRQALRQQQPFDLLSHNSNADAPNSDQNSAVEIRWIPVAHKLNRFILKSQIDGQILSDAPRYRLHGKTVESTNGHKLIRLIELYLLKSGGDNEGDNQSEPDDLQSMVRQVATACGTALLPFVEILYSANMRTIAVRFAMGADLVEYSVGSNEQPLADEIMAAVDDVFIPLLHGRAMGGSNGNGNERVWRVELILRLLNLD